MTDGFNRRTLVRALGAAAGLGALGRFSARAAPSGDAQPDLGAVTLRIGDQTGAQRGKLKAAGLLDDVPYRID